MVGLRDIPQGEPAAILSESLTSEERFNILVALVESALNFYAGRDNDGEWKKVSTATGPQYLFNWKPDTQDYPQEIADRVLVMIKELRKESYVQTTQ